MSRSLEFKTTLQISSRSNAFKKKGVKAAEHAVRDILNIALEAARENVAEGRGPSPHSGPFDEGHNSELQRKDTGDLRRSLRKKMVFRGFITEGSIETDLSYGVYLEVGWRKGQKFFRYPWLKPAFLLAMGRFPAIAAYRLQSEMNDLDEEQVVKDAELESWAAAAKRWGDSIVAEKAAEQRAIEADRSMRRPVYVKNPRIPRVKTAAEFLRHDTRQEKTSKLRQIRALAGTLKDVDLPSGRAPRNRFGEEKPSAYRLHKRPGESTTEAHARQAQEKLDAEIKHSAIRRGENKLRIEARKLKNTSAKLANPITEKNKQKRKKKK